MAIPVLILVLSLVLAVTAGACPLPPDEEGCTPGYWKNHMDVFLGGAYGIIEYVEGDHYIVKIGADPNGDHYIVKLAEGENAIGWLGGDHNIVRLGTDPNGDHYIVKLGAADIQYLGNDYYDVNLGGDHYIVKGTMEYPAGISLDKALRAKGPGLELVRHGAAAILNATNPYVDFSLTPDEVIAYFLAGNAAPLVEANEQHCPLN